jgi:hypothetical protein
VALAAIALPGRRRAAALAFLPSLALASWWLAIRALRGVEGETDAGPIDHGFGERLSLLPYHLLDWFVDRGGAAWLAAWAVAFAGCVIAWARSRRASQPAFPPWLLPALVAGAGLAYLFLPYSVRHMRFLYPRYASVACILAVVAVPLAAGGMPRVLAGALAAFALSWPAYLTVQFRRFDRSVGDFAVLAAQVERDSCVAPALVLVNGGPVIRNPYAYTHFPEYLTVWRDALPGYTFAATEHSPLGLRRPDGALAARWEDARLPVVLPPRDGSPAPQQKFGFYRYFVAPKTLGFTITLRGQNIAERLAGAGPLELFRNPYGTCGR